MVALTEQALLEQAKFLVERKRYTEALRILSRAIGINPEFHDLYCQMSDSLEGLNRLPEALKAADGAVRTYPTSACGHQRRSYLLAKLKRFEESLLASEESLRHSPLTSESHYAHALALEALERYDEADAAAEETVRCGPDRWHGFYLKARFAERREQFQAALDLFTKALSFEPERVVLLHGSARMLNKLGQDEEAIRRYETCLRLDPTNIDLGNNLRRLRQLGTRQTSSSMSKLERAAWRALQDGRVEAAWNYGQQLIKLLPSAAAGYRIAGSVEYRHENWSASEVYFQHALDRDPDDLISMNGLANAFLYQGRASDAERLYQKILDGYSQGRVFRMNWRLARIARHLPLTGHPRLLRLWARGLFRLIQWTEPLWRTSIPASSLRRHVAISGPRSS